MGIVCNVAEAWFDFGDYILKKKRRNLYRKVVVRKNGAVE